MFRVLAALLLLCATIQISGCTGSLRLGSSIDTQLVRAVG